jgi:hypothetical protein
MHGCKSDVGLLLYCWGWAGGDDAGSAAGPCWGRGAGEAYTLVAGVLFRNDNRQGLGDNRSVRAILAIWEQDTEFA